MRQGQIRYTHNFGGGFSGAIAVENPKITNPYRRGASLRTGAGAPSSGLQVVASSFARDSTPDFIGRIRYESPQVNLTFSGVLTRSTAPPPTVATPIVPGNGQLGFGVHFAGRSRFHCSTTRKTSIPDNLSGRCIALHPGDFRRGAYYRL